jgi:hypothetical protein
MTMSPRARVITLAAAWLVSLVAVAAVAQSPSVTPLPTPVVVSGADIGFRIEGHHGRIPVGTLVIRVDGRWVEPRGQSRVVPAGSR